MKNKFIRIGVPVIILLIIVGIFIVKNLNEDTEQQENLKFPYGISKIDLEEMNSHGLPIIIDFGADSCEPCRRMAPILRNLNREMQDKAIIQYLDTSKYSSVAKQYPVLYIPTQIFYTADGKPFVPSDELKSDIEFETYTHKDTGEPLYTVHVGFLSDKQLRTILAEMGVE